MLKARGKSGGTDVSKVVAKARASNKLSFIEKTSDKKENNKKYLFDWSFPPVALGWRDTGMYKRALKAKEDMDNMAAQKGFSPSQLTWESSGIPFPWFPGWREEVGYDYPCCRPVYDCCNDD